MLLLHHHHWLRAILHQFQPAAPVDTEKPAKDLSHITQHIPAGFNIIFRIN